MVDPQSTPMQRDYQTEYHRWSARHRQRVSAAELERLRQPENRLESLCYGPGRDVVCLACGLQGKVLSSHVDKCPEGSTTAPKYKAKWGFARKQGLRSQEIAQRVRGALNAAVLAGNPGYRNVNFDALQRRGNAARKGKRGIRLRLQTILERKSRRYPRQPKRQIILDPDLLKIMALGLPLAEGAKRAGLSLTAYYQRIKRLGYLPGKARAERRTISRYLSDLRTWFRQQASIPTVEQILEWHATGLRAGQLEAFQPFTPYLPHLEAELKAQPALIAEIIRRRDISAVGPLATKIFQRAHSLPDRAAKSGQACNPPSEATVRKGKFCDRIIWETRQVKRLYVDQGRSLAEIQTEHPEFAVWNLRETLTEEDRDVFNHPQQWGPVVGYARMILARQYGRHPLTVRDWVSSYRKVLKGLS